MIFPSFGSFYMLVCYWRRMIFPIPTPTILSQFYLVTVKICMRARTHYPGCFLPALVEFSHPACSYFWTTDVLRLLIFYWLCYWATKCKKKNWSTKLVLDRLCLFKVIYKEFCKHYEHVFLISTVLITASSKVIHKIHYKTA